MPDEPEQTQIPTARASAFNGSLPPPGKSDTMDELMCTVRVPSGTRHASYADSTRSPGSAAHRDPLTFIYHRFYARVGQSQQGTRKLLKSSHHFVEWVALCSTHPAQSCQPHSGAMPNS